MSDSFNKTALIVVDVQNYFVNDKTRRLPYKIANFIRKNKFEFVLFTKFVNHKNSNHFKKLGWKKCCFPPDTNIHPALLQFVDTKRIFIKTSYSVFKSRPFLGFLRKKKIKKIFLCGLDIDSCVLASAFDGFDLGYEMHILKKLSSSHSGRKFASAAGQIIAKCLERK